LGWIVNRSRPSLALLAIPLFATAWAAKGSLVGQAAALALTALGCLALGWLLTAVTPIRWLKAGIVLAAIVDSALVIGDLLQAPNATLNAAAPPGGLPQLQFVAFGTAVMGYGDLFLAAVLGSVLLLEGTSQKPVALTCLAFAGMFDLLFFVTNELPATVPVAVALLVSEARRNRLRVRGDGGRL
jgi:hypothetical protein